jgi:hypothetical protein
MLTKVSVNKDFYEIKIPVEEANNIESIRRFIDYLRIREISSKSTATDEEIAKLSKDINKDFWQNNKDKLLN